MAEDTTVAEAKLRRATTGYKRHGGPTVAQLNAIELLVEGRSDQETADGVGVHRVTVTRWRNYDPGFQAELNRRRREIWQASTDRLRALIPKALQALEEELATGQSRAQPALALIRMSGLLAAQTERTPIDADFVGPETAQAIIDAMARARRPQPFDYLVKEDPVTEAERSVVLCELAEHFGTPEQS